MARTEGEYQRGNDRQERSGEAAAWAIGCTVLAAVLALGGCHPITGEPTASEPSAAYSDYDAAVDGYANQVTKSMAQPGVTVVAVEHYGAAPIGTFFAGQNPLAQCVIPSSALPDPQTGGWDMGYHPPIGSDYSFKLGASVPPQLTGGILDIGAEVQKGRTVALGFDSMRRYEVLDDAFQAAIQDPACVAAIKGRTVGIVRGYITARESYKWQDGIDLGAKATITKGPGFEVAYVNGNVPVSYVEAPLPDKPDPRHFMLITWANAVAAPAAAAPTALGDRSLFTEHSAGMLGASRTRRRAPRMILAPAAPQADTLAAIQAHAPR